MLKDLVPIRFGTDGVIGECPDAGELLAAGGTAAVRLHAKAEKERGRFAISLGVAVAAHVGLLVALALAHQDGLAGAEGVHIDAISIEVVVLPATMFESQHLRLDRPGQSQPLQTTAIEGAPATQTPPANDAQEPQIREPDPVRLPPEKVTPPAERVPLSAETQLLLSMQDQPDAHQIKPRDEQEKPDQQRKPLKTNAELPPSPPPIPDGGAIASAASEQTRSGAGIAAASPGARQLYAKSVVEALSKNRPKGLHPGLRGTVRISFVIGADGAVAIVRIANSSGDQTLDGIALNAVRRVQFQQPPLGMSVAQRTYEVPYRFR
jgi:periplasmic protein TonB